MTTVTVWGGSSSTDWHTAANWTNGVPTTSLIASIPSAPSNQPNMSSDGTAHALQLDSGATLTGGSNITLYITGESAGETDAPPNGMAVNLDGAISSELSLNITYNNTTSVDLNATSGNIHDLTLASTGSSLIINSEATCVLDGNLTINAGEFNANGNALTIAGNLVLEPTASAGTANNSKLTCGSSTVTVTGKLDTKGTWHSGGYSPKSIYDGGSGTHSYNSMQLNVGTDVTLSSGVTSITGLDGGASFRPDVNTTYNTYSNGSGTVKFTSASNQQLYSTGQAADAYNQFYNLILEKTSSTLQGLTTVGFHIKVQNDLTLTSGVLDTATTNGTVHDLTVAGDTTISGGTLTCNSSTVNLRSGGSGSTWGLRVNSGTFNGGTGTHNMGGGTLRGGSWIWSNGTTTLNGGETSSSASTFYASGGTFTAGTGTVVVDADSTLQWLLYGANITVYNLTVTASDHLRLWQPTSDGSGTRVLTVSGDLSIAGTLDTDFGSQDDVDITVTGNTSGAGTLILNNSTYTGDGHLSMTGTVTIDTSGVITGVDQLGESGGTITCTGSPTLGFERWRQPTANWTPATSTIKLEGHSRLFQTDGYGTPYNLEIDNTGNTNELGGIVVVSNNLIITAGTLSTSSSNYAITVTEECEVKGGTLTLNGSTVNVGDMKITSGTVNGNTSTINLNTGGVDGWAWFHSGGTWNYNTSTVVYKTNGKHMEGEFYNLTIECSSSAHTGVWRKDGIASELMKAAGALTVKEGHWKRDSATESMEVVGVTSIESGGKLGNATSDNITANDTFTGGITIASGGEFIATRGTSTLNGDFDNTGTFTHNSGLVSLIASAGNITINGTGTVEPAFHDLSYEGSSDVRVRRDITVEDTLNINGSRFLFGSTSGGGQADATLTMGTSSAKGTLTVQSGKTFDFYIYGDSQTDKLQGASTLFPVDVTVNGTMNFSVTTSEPDTGKVQLANINYIGLLTLDNGDKIELTGDCEFDAVTVSTGATLDLNGQRCLINGTFTAPGVLKNKSASDTDTALLIVNGQFQQSGGSAVNSDYINVWLNGTASNAYWNAYQDTWKTIFVQKGATMTIGGNRDYSNSNLISAGLSNLGSDWESKNMTMPVDGELNGNAKNMTCTGDFTASGGLIGLSGIDFEGSGHIQIPDNAALDFTTAMTLEGWVKTTATGNFQHLICKSGGFYFLSVYNAGGGADGKAMIRIYDGANIDAVGTSKIDDGKWHHIAGTYDTSAGKLKLYVDGKLEAETSNSDAINTSSTALFLGANDSSGSSNNLTGDLARASLWNVALTPAQIRSRMFSDFTGLDSNTGCIAWYQFDEGTGGNGDTTANSVGASHTGTLGPAGTAPNWAGAATIDKTGGFTLTMAATTQNINIKSGLDIYNLTINDGSTTSLHTIDNTAGLLDIYGNLTVNEKLTSSASSNTSGIRMKTAAKTLTVAADVKTTALATLYQVVLDHGGITEIGEMNLKYVDVTSGATLKATGDFTVTTELQVNNACTFNANGKTLTCKLVDMNGSSTLDLASSTLILSSTDGLTSAAQTTLNGGPGCVIDGDASGQKVIFQSQGHWEIVGNISDLNVTNEELVVHGQVTNCTGDIHQWLPHFERDVMLDSDTSSDTSIDRADDIDRNNELIN